jgi:putative phosphoesterase
MEKILIVSDSHGLTSELEVIKERHQASLLLHCGDSELTSGAAPLSGFVTVKGNCDWRGDFLEEEIVDHDGLRFLITHGHLHNINYSLLPLTYRALEVGANIVCFGHSHIAYAEKVDEQLFINPGSIRQPRQFAEPSYVLLERESTKEIKVTFYHPNGKEITSFPYNKQFKIKS